MNEENTNPNTTNTNNHQNNISIINHQTYLAHMTGILNQAIRRPHRGRLVLLEDVALKALFSFPE